MPPTDGSTSAAPAATIANLLAETRSYAPPADLALTANVGPEEWARAAADPVAFWEEQARRLDWVTPWETAHTWEPARPVAGSDPADPAPELTVPAATWFAGGTLNVAVNCVDRHVDAGRGDKVALHFEGEPGDRRSDHLRRPAARGREGRQRADGARHRPGRPRRHLPAGASPRRSSSRSPSPASAPSTRSSSAGSRPRRCGSGSRTPGRSCSSPPTGSTAGAPPCRSSRTPTPRSTA